MANSKRIALSSSATHSWPKNPAKLADNFAEILKARPCVQIPSAPPSSPSVLVLAGESPEKRACARVCARTWGQRKLQIRTSPQNRAKVIRSPFWKGAPPQPLARFSRGSSGRRGRAGRGDRHFNLGRVAPPVKPRPQCPRATRTCKRSAESFELQRARFEASG